MDGKHRVDGIDQRNTQRGWTPGVHTCILQRTSTRRGFYGLSARLASKCAIFNHKAIYLQVENLRATPPLNVKVKFTVKNPVCMRLRLAAHGEIDRDFDYDSQEWSCSKNTRIKKIAIGVFCGAFTYRNLSRVRRSRRWGGSDVIPLLLNHLHIRSRSGANVSIIE